MAQPVNLWLSLRFGQLEVNMSADDIHGYAPDVANDMAKHRVLFQSDDWLLKD